MFMLLFIAILSLFFIPITAILLFSTVIRIAKKEE